MKFERGKDPKEAMEVGMRSRAPIVYRLLFIEDGDTLIGVSSSQVVSILMNLQYFPRHVLKYHVEFMDKEARIFSGTTPLANYAGKIVKYQRDFYHIPELTDDEI